MWQVDRHGVIRVQVRTTPQFFFIDKQQRRLDRSAFGRSLFGSEAEARERFREVLLNELASAEAHVDNLRAQLAAEFPPAKDMDRQ